MGFDEFLELRLSHQFAYVLAADFCLFKVPMQSVGIVDKTVYAAAVDKRQHVRGRADDAFQHQAVGFGLFAFDHDGKRLGDTIDQVLLFRQQERVLVVVTDADSPALGAVDDQR